MQEAIAKLMSRMPPEVRDAPPSRQTAAEASRMRVEVMNQTVGNLRYLDCPDCRNRGHVFESRQSGLSFSEVAVDCHCMKRRHSLKMISESGLASLMERCSLDSYIPREPWQERARSIAQAYLETYKTRWFCALGSVGAGKTHLCTAICRELLERDCEVFYMLWLRDSPALKGVPESMSQRERTMKKLISVDVLYIDDLFKTESRGKPSAADIRLAHEVLSARESARRTTLISSEWSMNELLGFDEAVGSRIYMMSRGFVLDFTGDKNQRLV